MTVVRMAAHIAGVSENEWMIGRRPPLSTEQSARLEAMCLSRARGVPLQYLFGEAWFLDSAYLVGPGVFVPRPDTEILVIEALSRLKSMDPGNHPVRFADVCTGSGCVGLSLAAAWLVRS